MTNLFSNYKFRCSSLGALMTESQGKNNLEKYEEETTKLQDSQLKLQEATAKLVKDKPLNKTYINLVEKVNKLKKSVAELELVKDEITLSATCISKLIEIYIQEVDGRRYDTSSRYTVKGNSVEDLSISVVSDLDGEFYVKNSERLENEYISGECDILKQDEIEDVKSSWNLKTFRKVATEPLNPMYWWQGQGYMWLWGKENYRLSYVLIDTPEALLLDEYSRLKWDMGSLNYESDAYYAGIEEIKKNNTYPELSEKERVFRKRFKFVPEAIEALKLRIEACRKWLNKYHEERLERNANIEELEFEEVEFFIVKTNLSEKDKEIVKEILVVAENAINELKNEIGVKVEENEQLIKEEGKVNVSISLPIHSEELSLPLQKEVEEQGGLGLIAAVAEIRQYNSIILEIEDCKNELEVVDLRKTYLNEFNTIPEIKNAFTVKRDSFKPAATPPPPAVAPAPKAVKPVAAPKPTPAAPPAPVPVEKSIVDEVREFVKNAKTAQEIKDYFKDPEKNKLLGIDKDLRNYVNEIGDALSKGIKKKEEVNVDDL